MVTLEECKFLSFRIPNVRQFLRLVAFAVGYTCVAVIIEVFVTSNDRLWEWIDSKFRADSRRLKQYELVEKECTIWPPVSSLKMV